MGRKFLAPPYYSQRAVFLRLLRALSSLLFCGVQAEDVYASVENKLYDLYDEQRPVINDKLQELYDTLGRIATLEEEIHQFKQSLACLYEDVAFRSS